MPYNKRFWHNLPETITPIDAESLNNLEDGVEFAVNAIDAIRANADPAFDTLVEISARLGADSTALASLLASVNDRYTKVQADARFAQAPLAITQSFASAASSWAIPSASDTGQALTWIGTINTGLGNERGAFWATPGSSTPSYCSAAMAAKPTWGRLRFAYYAGSGGTTGTVSIGISSQPISTPIPAGLTMAAVLRSSRSSWGVSLWQNGAEVQLAAGTYSTPLNNIGSVPIENSLAFKIIGNVIHFRTPDGVMRKVSDSRVATLGGANLFVESFAPAASDDIPAIFGFDGGCQSTPVEVFSGTASSVPIEMRYALLGYAKRVNGVAPDSVGDITIPAPAHTHPTSQIVDLAEYIQDTVAGLIKAGTNVTVAYDDPNNTFTINATGGGGTGTTDPETVRDTIAAAMVAGSGISITVDDANDTITVAVAGVPQASINGLTAALAGKEPTIAPGTTSQYWRGDKTWATLPSGGGGNDPRFNVPQAYTIGDGVSAGPYNITHNGNSRASIVSVRQKKAPFKEIRLIDVAHPSLSALQVLTDKVLPVCEVDVLIIAGTTDTTLPSTATVSFVSKTDTQVVLSATATDDVAVDYFNWFRDNNYVGSSPAGQNYTDSGRAPNTTYSYTATAVDTSGNESAAKSTAVPVTTNVSTTPPTFDTASSANGNGNQTANYTVPAGQNRTVYAAVSHINSGANGSSVSVTIGGTAATLVSYQGGSGQAWVGVYKRDNVPPGAVSAVATTGENYVTLVVFSFVPVASTAAQTGTGGASTAPASSSVAVAGNETLISVFSCRESPTVATGTLRASYNHSSGFQFVRVLEATGASPRSNTLTMANAAWACVSFKAAA